MGYTFNEHDENQVTKIYKQRKKRKIKKNVKILMGLLIVLLIGSYLISGLSKVKTIKIQGTDITSQEEVLKTISMNQSSFYWLVSTSQVEEEIKTIPSVKNVEVKCDWIGNVKIVIEEAIPIAYAQIEDNIYEINDIGHAFIVDDEQRIKELKVLPFVSQMNDEKILKEFAKEYQYVSEYMRNEISDIILEPKNADPTRLKCLLSDNYIIYIRIEDLKERLGEKSTFDLDAYKALYPDESIFKFEGGYIRFGE